MGKFVRDVLIVDSKRLNDDHFVLTLDTGSPYPEIRPGQFIQLKIEGSSETFLRRPFSVHDYDGKGTIKVLVRVVGPGTRRLAEYRSGDSINALFPLGNSFSMPASGENVLLAGGGCGIAPLLFLGKELRNRKINPLFLLGFRNRESMIEIEQYRNLGDVYITTEDGSEGEKGFLTDHSLLDRETFNRIYCCGPEPMMMAVADYARRHGSICEVSLEHLMACGFGACLCCVVPTLRGNLCTCTEGPVFNSNELKWQISR
ncbi:MAG: dihydroorotate dehydrogenase electron transfer subunit [Bacteroidales bacterium]|nr:dihydroorotate dehydrogenase electron transfer subunit [Bacteroidales bacterium]